VDFTISDEAQDDIAHIFEYTIDKWGLSQAHKYQEILDSGLDTIRNTPLSPYSKNVEHKKIPTRYLRVGKHHIYYTLEDDLIIILRVLHGQMNPDLHL